MRRLLGLLLNLIEISVTLPRPPMQKPKSIPAGKRNIETNADVLRRAVHHRVQRRITGKMVLSFPAVPALVDHYIGLIRYSWLALERKFSEDDLTRLRDGMLFHAQKAFNESPSAILTITSETAPLPQNTISFALKCHTMSMEEKYAEWVRERKPPLFGKYPDSKVMDLAHSLSLMAECPVIDVGAGTGRNTIPLARAGYPTDAVEMAPALASVLREEVSKEQLPVAVFEGDILDDKLPLAKRHYRLMVMAEVIASHFRTVAEVRQLFKVAEKVLAPGGMLLFSAFVAHEGYQPDELARQVSQLTWSCIYTLDELNEAASGLPFELVSNESTLEYEKSRLPAEHWPPTGWFESWAAGANLFDMRRESCPMELRWLVYRKNA